MSEISRILFGADAVVPEAGGKGAALAKLAATFPVPAFFVISADAFDAGGMKAAAREEVKRGLQRLGGAGPFAVRSSGLEEDGASSAHAGQFATELNVAAADVEAAAQRVWQSGFTDSLAAYRRAHGLSGDAQPPAVIVQVMVAARAAGVAFSADPVSGDRSVVVISAIRGLADKLVGGEEDGDSYRIAADGATLEAELVDGEAVLSEAERAEVAAMARRAAAYFGCPQDIEWAVDAGGLKMLQSRPITTLGSFAAHPDFRQDERGDTDDVVIWDNSNIVESYPGVTSPLTFSFARYVYAHVYQAFSRLMGVPGADVEEHRAVFENMLGRVDGRVYYNLLNWYRALALFPGFKANRKFMEGMMGVSEALPQEMADRIAPPSTSGWERFVDNLKFGRVGLGLVWHEIRIKGTIAKFYERLNAALARPDAEIDGMEATALAAEYRLLERQLLARWDAPLVNDFLCMIAFGLAQKTMEKAGGDDGRSFLSNMLIGQGDIVSAEPARMIREMGLMVRGKAELVARLAKADVSAVDALPELRAAFDRYIAKFGDRCTQELKLESRTLHEDPAQVLMAISAAAATRGAEAAKEDERDLREIIPEFGKRVMARWVLDWAKARVRDRENLRFERTRLFGRVRRIFLALGARLTEAGVLNAPRDVFCLTVEELLGAVEGAAVTGDLKALVRLRQAEWGAQLKRPDPPERFSARGAHVVGVAALSVEAQRPGETGEVRKGLACCKGVVTARVRVIDDPRVEALAPGEILVARHTDPGWIAVFANAAGVIAERGSLLSHSAIVAREMGVPCVVSLKGVTQWLRTGDVVRLDGGAGTVERIGGGTAQGQLHTMSEQTGANTDIASRASFDIIRYAQAWEDADILAAALRVKPSDIVVSIASAGDNALALLAEGAERVIAVDLNPTQLACVRLRMAMYRTHSHHDFLELMGSRPSGRRRHLLELAAAKLSDEDQAFWAARKEEIGRYGVGGVGKFERYFRTFREWVIPFIHTKEVIDLLLTPREPDQRAAFYDKRWNNWGWRQMVKVFFSRFVMGRLGRDPAFFDHVEGGPAAQVARLTRKALVDQDPSENPYLHWILKGMHGEALPRALEAERFETIRDRLDRFEVRLCTVETLASEGVKADAFNLSDIFEYMSPEAHEAAYATILAASNPGARIAYWNMMAPRRVPASLAARVKTNSELEAKLKPLDKAFFYSDFVIEEVV